MAQLSRISERDKTVLMAVRRRLEPQPHLTEYFQGGSAHVSFAEAVVALMRLERTGKAVSGRSMGGMTWRAVPAEKETRP